MDIILELQGQMQELQEQAAKNTAEEQEVEETQDKK